METLTVASSVVNVEDHHLFVYALQKPIPWGKSCFLRLNPGSRIRSNCSLSKVFHGCLECPAEPQLGSWGTSVQGPAWLGVACWRAGPGSLPTTPGPGCLRRHAGTAAESGCSGLEGGHVIRWGGFHAKANTAGWALNAALALAVGRSPC